MTAVRINDRTSPWTPDHGHARNAVLRCCPDVGARRSGAVFCAASTTQYADYFPVPSRGSFGPPAAWDGLFCSKHAKSSGPGSADTGTDERCCQPITDPRTDRLRGRRRSRADSLLSAGRRRQPVHQIASAAPRQVAPL